MRILIFGKSGQVGLELARLRWPAGYDAALVGRSDCDLQNADAVSRAVARSAADIVINAAAYTAVDRAESEPDVAARVNRDAPAAMARACNRSGAILIHLSTDYVFDGTKTDPYSEEDPVRPLSVYGRTKAEGEAAIRQATVRHVILRTSWVFAAHGANFVRTVLRLACEKPELRIVCDQTGAPTSARDIAGAVVAIVGAVARDCGAWGTFHFTSSEPTTWHGFAQAIVEHSALSTTVLPITTAEYRTPARRPTNSVLDCRRIGREYGIAQPVWRRALATVLAEIKLTRTASKGRQA